MRQMLVHPFDISAVRNAGKRLLQGLLDGDNGAWGVKCDIATRISRRGALTWWHLDDGGEFVLQVSFDQPMLTSPATSQPLECLYERCEIAHASARVQLREHIMTWG